MTEMKERVARALARKNYAVRFLHNEELVRMNVDAN